MSIEGNMDRLGTIPEFSASNEICRALIAAAIDTGNHERVTDVYLSPLLAFELEEEHVMSGFQTLKYAGSNGAFIDFAFRFTDPVSVAFVGGKPCRVANWLDGMACVVRSDEWLTYEQVKAAAEAYERLNGKA